uniref:Abhydrolase domain containing 15a n=1 Tax=Kryptolebias marmoratus TaxID=37003 RepID=A0A3Q2ZXJ6_KRYMA
MYFLVHMLRQKRVLLVSLKTSLFQLKCSLNCRTLVPRILCEHSLKVTVHQYLPYITHTVSTKLYKHIQVLDRMGSKRRHCLILRQRPGHDNSAMCPVHKHNKNRTALSKQHSLLIISSSHPHMSGGTNIHSLSYYFCFPSPQLCEMALAHGYLPAVFNRRSHNGTPLTTLKLQQFGDPSDLREAVRYIRYRQPAGRLYAVSESSGSGLLLSYLGECGSSSYMTAAVCLSPVFRCQSWFENDLCRPLQWVLALYQKISLSRYRTALGDIMHTDALFSSCSLRGVEEALFCHTSVGWDSYWERNEPLRDVDEVAIPVLSVCSRDDPVRGDAQSTIPLELFETNPHFFLLLTDRGGHCGFSAHDDTNWSHKVVLEFFRATTDFFNAEERAKQLAARRRGLGGGLGGRAFRHRSVSTCKRVPACSHNIHAIYSWQRSYTQ